MDETFDLVTAARDDAPNAVRFRRGFMLGDGTGAGKGRQSAGIILDNWLKGRRKAVWISKSDKLLEDAQRDWSALGMERLLITPLSRFPQGKPIRLAEGVLFLTYATLRSDDRGEKLSRVRQIVEWLGSDFDGVIIFDESHAMQNAGGGKGERGDVAPSQQGRAGLRLQHALPDARVVYVSATGATTVHNLAYAQRLGLWGGGDFPFATRAEFVEAIEDGGVAAMEVLARDLRSLGLYTARSLSYDGVEYELVEHALSDEQRRIYNAYAGAFAIIHNHLDAAMQAANITAESGTLNAQAKSAARSAFESAKQRCGLIDFILAGSISDIFDALVVALADTRLEPDIEDLLWSTVNVFHRAIDRTERALDGNELAQQRSQREQDGSEVKSVELERLTAEGQTLIERRNAFELMRDQAADQFEHHTHSAWRPRNGSKVNHRNLTSAMVDSRDFLSAKKRADKQVLLPAGPKVALTGGLDFNDHRLVWAKLDQVHAKHADMVLLHGGSPKGAELIAAKWADNRKVPQIAFKPDWTKHANAAPFKRNDAMLDVLPIGVLHFPGTGIQDNLAEGEEARHPGLEVRQRRRLPSCVETSVPGLDAAPTTAEMTPDLSSASLVD